MTGIDARPRSATEIIDAAFNLLRQRYSAYVRVAAIMYLPLVVLLLGRYVVTGAISPTSFTVGYAVTIVIQLLWVTITDSVLAIMTSQLFVGGEAEGDAAIRLGLSRAIPIVIAGTTTFIMAFIGSIFLLAPGVYLFSRFGLSPVVAAIEGAGPGKSLGRASALSRDNKLHYLGTLLIVFVLYFVVSGAVGIIVALFGVPAVTILTSAAVSVFLLPVAGAVHGLIYYDLRIRNEGYDIQLMSERLDPAPAPLAG